MKRDSFGGLTIHQIFVQKIYFPLSRLSGLPPTCLPKSWTSHSPLSKTDKPRVCLFIIIINKIPIILVER